VSGQARADASPRVSLPRRRGKDLSIDDAVLCITSTALALAHSRRPVDADVQVRQQWQGYIRVEFDRMTIESGRRGRRSDPSVRPTGKPPPAADPSR
jgi:hypothetical protein